MAKDSKQIFQDWSNEDSLRLIEAYKAEHVLWDVENRGDNEAKNQAWQNLAAQLNVDGTLLERKIKVLRNSYRRELNREIRTAKEHPDNPYKSKWYAYEAFKFLYDLYVTREVRAYTLKPKKVPKIEKSPVKLEMIKSEMINLDDLHTFRPYPRLGSRKRKAPATNSVECVDLEDNNHDGSDETDNDKKECHVFGEFVATKLLKFSKAGRLELMHSLNNVIYQHELGLYGSGPAQAGPSNDSSDPDMLHADYIIYNHTGIADQVQHTQHSL